MVSNLLSAVSNYFWPAPLDERQVVVYALKTDHNGERVRNAVQSIVGTEKQVTLKLTDTTFNFPTESDKKVKYHLFVVPGGWGRIVGYAQFITHLYKHRVFFVRGITQSSPNIREREEENLRALLEDPFVAPFITKEKDNFIEGVAAFDGSFREDNIERLRKFFKLPEPQPAPHPAPQVEPQIEVSPPNAKRQKVEEVKPELVEAESEAEASSESSSSVGDS